MKAQANCVNRDSIEFVMDGIAQTQLACGADADNDAGAIERLSLWRRLVRKGGFPAQVLTLMSGTVLAQGAMVLLAPVLTRLYDPTDFAIYALFAIGANLLSAVAGGRYEFALMLPEEDQDAVNVLALALGLSVAVTLTTLGVVAVVWPLFISGHAPPGGGIWIWFVPVAVLIYSWYIIGVRWETRKNRFKNMARAEVGASVGALTTQITIGVLLASPTGIPLICGQLVGRFIAVGILWTGMGRDLFRFRSRLSRQGITSAAKRYWRFPVFTGGASLLAKATQEVPRIMLSAFFAPQILGFFTLSLRVLGLPMSLVGQSIAWVFFPHISANRHDSRRSVVLLLRTSGTLFLLILIPMLILLLWADDIFAFVFGEEWRAAGHYTRLLIPVLMAQFCVQPISLSMQAFEKQQAVFLWQTLFLCLTVGAFFLGHRVGNVDVAILSYSLLAMTMYILYFGMSIHYARARQWTVECNKLWAVTDIQTTESD